MKLILCGIAVILLGLAFEVSGIWGMNTGSVIAIIGVAISVTGVFIPEKK